MRYWGLIEGTFLENEVLQLCNQGKCEIMHLFVFRSLPGFFMLFPFICNVQDALHNFDFQITRLSVSAFLAGGDPCHLEPLWTSLMFDGSVLPGASIPSSSSLPSSSSVSTNGSVKDLVISRVSGGDMWGSFNKGELDALGASHPLLGAGTSVLLGEGIVHGWWHKGNGPNHGLTKLDGGPPSNCGGTHSPQLKANWGGNLQHYDLLGRATTHCLRLSCTPSPVVNQCLVLVLGPKGKVGTSRKMPRCQCHTAFPRNLGTLCDHGGYQSANALAELFLCIRHLG